MTEPTHQRVGQVNNQTYGYIIDSNIRVIVFQKPELQSLLTNKHLKAGHHGPDSETSLLSIDMSNAY